MGYAGFALPLLVYGLTMTSLRIGVGASGVRMAQGLQDTDDRVRECPRGLRPPISHRLQRG